MSHSWTPMFKRVVGAVAAAAFLDAGAAWAADQAGSASIVVGRVQVLRGGAWRGVWGRDPVFVGDRLLTGADGRVVITFIDKSNLTLSVNSQLEITKYLYDPEGGRSSFLRLFTGKMKAVVSKLSKMSSSYEFGTPTAVAGVRGTVLAIEVMPKGGDEAPEKMPDQTPDQNASLYLTEISVLEGLVDVGGLDATLGKASVAGGQSVNVPFGGGPGTVNPLSDSDRRRIDNISSGTSGGGSGQGDGGQGGGGAPGDTTLNLPPGNSVGDPVGGAPPIPLQPGEGAGKPFTPVHVEIHRVN